MQPFPPSKIVFSVSQKGQSNQVIKEKGFKQSLNIALRIFGGGINKFRLYCHFVSIQQDTF